MAEKKYYMGDVPNNCDLCKTQVKTQFVDGKTKTDTYTRGSWCNMCATCHKFFGVGLGTGKGQHYLKDETGQWYKVGG